MSGKKRTGKHLYHVGDLYIDSYGKDFEATGVNTRFNLHVGRSLSNKIKKHKEVLPWP